MYNILPEFSIPTWSGEITSLNEYPEQVLLTLRDVRQQLCKDANRTVSTICQIPADLAKEAGLVVVSDSSYHLQQKQGSTDLALRKLVVLDGNVKEALSQMKEKDIRDRICVGLGMVSTTQHLGELLHYVRMTIAEPCLNPSRISDIPGGDAVIKGAGYIYFVEDQQYRWIRDEDAELKLENATRLLDNKFQHAVYTELDGCINALQPDILDLGRLAHILRQDNVDMGTISRLEPLLRLAGVRVTPHPSIPGRFCCSYQSGVPNNDLRRKYAYERVTVAQERGELM